MIILFTLFFLDFILTYYGISIGAITEANPLLVWLFELPFMWSLILRLIMFLLIGYVPITLMKKHSDKVRPLFRKLYYSFAFGINLLIAGVHLYWMLLYVILS